MVQISLLTVVKGTDIITKIMHRIVLSLSTIGFETTNNPFFSEYGSDVKVEEDKVVYLI